MSKFFSTMLFLLAVFIFSAALAPAHAGGLKRGVPFEGELLPSHKINNRYTTEIPVLLKGGQSISIVATVVGKDRQAFRWLRDPAGAYIAQSDSTVKTAKLECEEVNAQGKYTIVIGSDRIGPFTVRATDPKDMDGDIKSLEATVERLEKELATARAKLKALKEKSK
jgi:hypothetical protein